MRRVDPVPSLALPPISGVDTFHDGHGWTLSERRLGGGFTNRRGMALTRPPLDGGCGPSCPSVRSKARSLSPGREPVSPSARSSGGYGGGNLTARGMSPHSPQAPPRANPNPSQPTEPASRSVAMNGALLAMKGLDNTHFKFVEDSDSVNVAFGDVGKQTNATKVRVIESWLNNTLSQAVQGEQEAAGAKSAASTAAKAEKGLSNFGIDGAALEKLGMDTPTAERIYRAMFVYSQGLHAVLQQAVAKSKNSSQALLVLWRAFTAVLEHAGRSEQHGAESLADLIQKGHDEERKRMEKEFSDQLSGLQVQLHKANTERRTLQDELHRSKEAEIRLWNEGETHRAAHQVAALKLEKEIKQRVDAEVRYLEKLRWADALQEDLNKERSQALRVQSLLSEANQSKETVVVELDSLRNQVKTMETQASAHKQNALESAQQRQRHDQQVAQYKLNIERMSDTNKELKDQFEAEAEACKRFAEQLANNQREARKLETQFEDEAHARKELQTERDGLRAKIDALESEVMNLMEERRKHQREINDLGMAHRTNQIELKRKSEALERLEAQYDKLHVTHRELLDLHRSLAAEAEGLREDVKHLEEQLGKESDLRKQLQGEKKQLLGQVSGLTIERDAYLFAKNGAEKELTDATEKIVKLEAIIRDNKSTIAKMSAQHQVEMKGFSQKLTMMEKVIDDERTTRRNLVVETQSVVLKREEALDKLKKKIHENQELKRQRLEKEEEADRLKVLLRAQEQRNSDQMVTIDKYQATVATHEAETRQMQVVLECEREEALRRLQEMEYVSVQAQRKGELVMEHWKMSYEDVLSRNNFNPASKLLQRQSEQIHELTAELVECRGLYETTRAKYSELERSLQERHTYAVTIEETLAQQNIALLEMKKSNEAVRKELELTSAKRREAEDYCERIKAKHRDLEAQKSIVEKKLQRMETTEEALMDAKAFEKKVVLADASVQVKLDTKNDSCQTDLSYQYLEMSDRGTGERWRQERLGLVKRASAFVAESEAQRDFNYEVAIATHSKRMTMELATPSSGSLNLSVAKIDFNAGAGTQLRVATGVVGSHISDKSEVSRQKRNR